MRLIRCKAAKSGEPAPRYPKEVYAPDPTFTPGTLPVQKIRWWADPQALRKAAEGGIFVAFVLIFGIYGSSLFYKSTESARRKSCRDNLHSVALCLTMYAQDYDGLYPPAGTDLARSLLKGVGMPARSLICPSDDLARPKSRKRRAVAQVPISYTYRPPGSGNPDSSPNNQPLLWDRGGGIPTGAHRQGGNILFVDGHTRWVPIDYWSGPDVPW